MPKSYRLANLSLLWAKKNLRSFRAVHSLNEEADMLSQGATSTGEWGLHPQLINAIWRAFGQADVDFFVIEENSHC